MLNAILYTVLCILLLICLGLIVYTFKLAVETKQLVSMLRTKQDAPSIASYLSREGANVDLDISAGSILEILQRYSAGSGASGGVNPALHKPNHGFFRDSGLVLEDQREAA